MSKVFLMGIDAGTSSLKTIIIDDAGNVKALASKSYQYDSPKPGWAEQDPEVWWDACKVTVAKALQQSGLAPIDIAGVSFSGQMHGLVMVDEHGNSVRPSILHCDARSGQQIRDITATLGADKVRRLIMNPVYTGFLLPSLLWVRDNEPEHYAKIRKVCLPKDYIKYKLSGELNSDYSDASATLAFDIPGNRWSTEVLNALDVPQAWFPDCFDTTAKIGQVTSEAAKATGLAESTAVVAGGADVVMQGIGNGVTGLNVATANIGSSAQVCFQSDKPVENPDLTTNTFCGYEKGRWIAMGAIMHGGLALKWYGGLIQNKDYAGLDREAAKVPAGSGGVVFLPYLNGERTPHVNPDLSGLILGCNLKTGQAQMGRAVMEGVAYALRQCMEICGGLGVQADMVIGSGGGASSSVWLQIQSDVYGLPLKVAAIEEQAALGAAIAAGVGCGVYKDVEDGCRRAVRYKDNATAQPNMENHKTYNEYYQLYKDAYKQNKELLERATKLGRAL